MCHNIDIGCKTAIACANGIAVNQALMQLNKVGYSRERFVFQRLKSVSPPFDKTGTLTTDQLAPVGVIPRRRVRLMQHGRLLNAVKDEMLACDDADIYTAMVLGGCHRWYRLRDLVLLATRLKLLE